MFSIALITSPIVLDLVCTIVGYALCVWLTLRWVHRSKQDDVPRSNQTDWMVVKRAAVIFGLLYGVCSILGVPVWTAYALLIVLILISQTGVEFAVFGIAIVYPLQQYLLGFPDRNEFRSVPPSSRDEDNAASRALGTCIGKHGRSFGQLKPAGEILIESQKYPAISETGDFIDEEEPMIVTGVRNGVLVVARVATKTAEPLA